MPAAAPPGPAANGARSDRLPRDALARAVAALQNGRPSEAAGICQDLLRVAGLAEPLRAEARKIREAASARIGSLAHTIELLEWSTRANPGNPTWLGILTDLYRRAGRLDDAFATAHEIARLQPSQSGPHITLARLHADRGDAAAACEAFLAAIAADPNNPVSHYGLAQMLLLKGEYGAGWSEYEWRHRLPEARQKQSRLRLTQWNGMRMPHGHLLLYTDQGYGDAFQFARYIPMVLERVGRVSLWCETACLPLFRAIPGLEVVTDTAEAVSGATAQIALTSLPGVFGTTVETIPSAHYLAADPAAVAQWRQRLDHLLPAGKLRVGLAWAGNPAHANDARRSIPPAALAQLASIPGTAFVGLQKDRRSGDEPALAKFGGLLDLSGELDDFGVTAAILENVDVMVSVDSSVAHLAGALARPIWLLIGTPPDWRWLEDRVDSPWYPSARLFRQTRMGDWTTVVASTSAELATLAAHKSRA